MASAVNDASSGGNLDSVLGKAFDVAGAGVILHSRVRAIFLALWNKSSDTLSGILGFIAGSRATAVLDGSAREQFNSGRREALGVAGAAMVLHWRIRAIFFALGNEGTN